MSVYNEIWTGETVKAFRNSAESLAWLSKIRNYSAMSNNNIIHFVDLGGDPNVLINNTTYPLQVATLTDADKPIALDKYQSQPTAVSRDSAIGASYDVKQTHIERHVEAINEKKYSKALHALAPSTNSAATPVVVSTGTSITKADILELKRAFDSQNVPSAGRILVLCHDHVNDLLASDQKFADQYYNYTTGRIANMYGFEIYEWNGADVYFTVASKTKVAFGATPDSSTDKVASVAFYAPDCMKAEGTTEAYIDEPQTTTQQWQYAVRTYFVCLPLKSRGIGALVTKL